MKILLVVRWPVGGIRTFINYVYKNVDFKDYELHFLMPDFPENEIFEAGFKESRCVWHYTKNDAPSFSEFSLTALKLMRQHNYKIVHAHGFTSAMAVSFWLPLLSISSIFTSHDVLNDGQFLGLKGKAKRFLMAFSLNRFMVIQSVSEDADENLKEQLPGIQTKKCIVVSNGVDTERFYSANPVNIKAHLGIANDTVVIGFFGRFMSQKGFKYLIEAMSLLNAQYPSKYCVVCFGAGGFIREEKCEIEKRGLAHSFFFHDFVPDIAPYVKGCDVVVMPSLWEACGLLAMEVITAGVPFVASSCIGLREVCSDTPAIMIEPANATSLVQGILKAQTLDPVILNEYRSVAKERFSIAITRKKILALYESKAN